MEDDQESQSLGSGFSRVQPPHLVSLIPFSPSISPSPRRLSSNFSDSTRPVLSARRLSWVSLQGRLVGADEASSARSIGGSLSREEAVAWELFSPIHRILIVAVIAVATADLKKSRRIWKLQKSVDLRDQVLLRMQQKLDDLCEQMNTIKDGTETEAFSTFAKNQDFPFNKDPKTDDTKISSCGCRPCERHQVQSNGSLRDSVEKSSCGDEMFKFKMPLMVGSEQEERRMSDLSDWASSVTSAADIQLNSLAIDQDICNLQRECEEKEATIKELSAIVHASDIAGSKRIAELEDVIRRKNMIITKLKKDMMVLEQKVIHLTRLRRPSSSASTLNVKQLPVMADNLVFDMESSTSPSSSDSDPDIKQLNPHVSVTHSNAAVRRNHRAASGKMDSISLARPSDKPPKPRHISPLKEYDMNQRPELLAVTLRPKQLGSAEGHRSKGNRKSIQRESKATATTPLKRWV